MISTEATMWYLAYGSNLQPRLLRRYLDEAPSEREAHWVEIGRELYFAGDSRGWSGPVAFLSLKPTIDPSLNTICLAISVTKMELARIFAAENGAGAALPDCLGLLAIGEAAEVLIRQADETRKGKYNVVLRGPDLAGKKSFTFTTSRTLAMGQPSADYMSAITAGLAAHPTPAEYLARRYKCRTGDNGAHLKPEPARFVWSGTLSSKGFSGYPVARLPRSLGPTWHGGNYLGTIRVGDRQASAWLSFGLEEIEAPQISLGLGKDLGIPVGEERESCLWLAHVYRPARIPGNIADLAVSDAVQVGEKDPLATSRWALAIGPSLSAPVRVLPRQHVQDGTVRVAYALRTLLNAAPGDPVVLQPIDPAVPSRLQLAARVVADRVLGAPPIALRATEGLVGDDGNMIARVDATALDFLGIGAGQEAVASWAERSVVVRVLLQTPETRETMVAQLAESTGLQRRASSGDLGARARTPEHLRVWLSSSARNALGVPPDTIVRLRRSIPHLLLRSASQAAVPAVGLIVAASALHLAWWLWLSCSLILIALVALPLRMKDR